MLRNDLNRRLENTEEKIIIIVIIRCLHGRALTRVCKKIKSQVPIIESVLRAYGVANTQMFQNLIILATIYNAHR